MTVEQELEFSYYQQVAEIKADHGIFLVQDVRTKQFYVKKVLTVYNTEIYTHLAAHPISNVPVPQLIIEDNGVLILIEEYIAGETLEEHLERRGTMSIDEIADIGIQLCDILADFHSCHPPIVNRDIKPSNIKITPDGAIKLLDLNAAKRSSPGDKDTVLLGTQGYAAPEQYGFAPSSPLTDIYSLGVLMNVLGTGELPNKRLVSGPLGDIISKCVELSPSARYQSVALLRNDLRALMKGGTRPLPHSGWRKFLPPGFRSNRPLRWILSGFGYLLWLDISLTLVVEDASPGKLLLNRLFFAVATLSIILFTGNYLNVQQKFPLSRSGRPALRWLGILFTDSAIIFLFLFLLVLLESLFF